MSFIQDLIKTIKLLTPMEVFLAIGIFGLLVLNGIINVKKIISWKRRESPCVNCFNLPAVIEHDAKTKKFTREINHMEEKLLPRDQLNVCEQVYDRFVLALLNTFCADLKTYGIEHPFESKEYCFYKKVLVEIKRDVMAEMRKIVRENNFIEKEASNKWQNYKEEKIKSIFTLCSELEQNYYTLQEPPKDYFVKGVEPFLNANGQEFLRLVNWAFDELLAISKNYQLKIKEKNDILDAEFNLLFRKRRSTDERGQKQNKAT